MKTIAHEFLDIESKYFDVPQKSYDNLDRLIELADKRLKRWDLPEEKLKKINFLLWREGYLTNANLLLSNSLFTKVIDCKHYSLLFYSIAEELHLPIEVMNYPEHVGIKWEDLNTRFLWEPTSGSKLSEEHYIKTFNIPRKSIGKYFIKEINRTSLFNICYDVIGLELYGQEESQEALELLNRALILDPDSYETLINRGTIRNEQGDVEGAVNDYKRALKIQPCPRLHFTLGYSYIFLGKNDLAEKHYNEAIKMDKNLPEAYIGRAFLNIGRKRFARALRDCNKAINLDKRDPLGYTHRSEIHLLMGNEDKAKEDELRYLIAFNALYNN
ncbi:tetratricopeptide repeat protein [Candidatus Woesearchaeota archaeon]|nr:tetratricopeptide repeat protein [Candidatus Woesearchaeota archaeon]